VSERERYERAWRDYRWRLAAVLLALGLFVTAPLLSDRFRSSWFGPLWLGSMIVASIRLSWWRCPRCARTFFSNLINNPLTRQCMHCGLPKWATTSDAGLGAEVGRAVPVSPRAEIRATAEEVQVAIRAKRNDHVVSFLRAWIVAWAVGEIIMTAVSLTKPMSSFEGRFVVVWLVSWTFTGVAAALALAWMSRGRTVLAARAGRLSLRRRVGPLGRTRELELGPLRSVRVVVLDTETHLGAAGTQVGLVGPSIELVGERSSYVFGPFATPDEAEQAARAVGAQTSSAVTPGIVTRSWRPSWIPLLIAVHTVIGGLLSWWIGWEFERWAASACSLCRPGEAPPMCRIPGIATTAGTAMVLLGGAAVVVLAARRVTATRRGPGDPAGRSGPRT
jgi:hypothetical protein